jgi:hypothetical protein
LEALEFGDLRCLLRRRARRELRQYDEADDTDDDGPRLETLRHDRTHSRRGISTK